MDLIHNCLRRWKNLKVFISSIFWCILLLIFLSLTRPQYRVMSSKTSINLLHRNIRARGILKTTSSNESVSVTYNLENNKAAVNLTNTKSETSNLRDDTGTSSVILTSWFIYQKDPQRGKQVSHTIDYIWNFYTTAKFLKLNVVIFHDHLPLEFVSKYKTSEISFQKIVPSKSFSTNDLRFISYEDHLKKNSYAWILMTDVSDVFFNSNPLVYMSQNRNNTSLFLSPDVGTFSSDGSGGYWMRDKMLQCYPSRVKSWIHEWRLNIFNAGVWGGYKTVVSCMLKCITNDLTRYLKGRGNCNMGTVNWCIRFGNCVSKKDIQIDNVKGLFVNPFRRDCENRNYSIIHNKCDRTEGNICAIIKYDTIEYKMNDGRGCSFSDK